MPDLKVMQMCYGIQLLTSDQHMKENAVAI